MVLQIYLQEAASTGLRPRVIVSGNTFPTLPRVYPARFTHNCCRDFDCCKNGNRKGKDSYKDLPVHDQFVKSRILEPSDISRDANEFQIVIEVNRMINATTLDICTNTEHSAVIK